MTASPITIVLIEDEAPIRRFIRASLSSQGMRVVEAPTGQEGLALTGSHHPELILLDLGLPDHDGLDVIRQIRRNVSTPIIVISARGKERDKIDALDTGADDYLTKPFSMGELLARIRVCLRHARQPAAGPDEPIFEAGPLRIDLAKRQVWVGGKEAHLTPIEYKLLALLVRHAGKVVTHRQVMLEIWGRRRDDENPSLRVHVHQLRQKLERNPLRPRHLVTEAGIGYRLKEE